MHSLYIRWLSNCGICIRSAATFIYTSLDLIVINPLTTLRDRRLKFIRCMAFSAYQTLKARDCVMLSADYDYYHNTGYLRLCI